MTSPTEPPAITNSFAASAAISTPRKPAKRIDIFGQVNSGGLSHAQTPTSSPPPSSPSASNDDDAYDEDHVDAPPASITSVTDRYNPRSPSAISLRAFLLGIAFSTFALLTITLIAGSHPTWRLTILPTLLSLFHFFEFYVTARYNARRASVSSFLLSANGSAYNLAYAAAFIECLLRFTIFADRGPIVSAEMRGVALVLGVLAVVAGQAVRSVAMAQAGSSFDHTVQLRRHRDHALVTHGIYAYFRHPSYFGYFCWALGTQLVMGNVFSTVAFALVLWRFFEMRIRGEEELLMGFFPEEYPRYRLETAVWIPFIR